MTSQSNSLDILGVKPIADSINKITAATVDGVSAFLSRICLPAAEEFGLLMRDRVRDWRAANLSAVVSRAEDRLRESSAPPDLHAHPRIVSGILEQGSWIDDPVVQDLWGGLLSSSCTPDGDDDSNLIFINLLSELTKLQAHVLKHVCENSTKSMSPNGLIGASRMVIPLDTLIGITGVSDIHRLDRELDHLREVGLIDGGFAQGYSTDATIRPCALLLHMYVRCQGSRLSPIDFFAAETSPDELRSEAEKTS